MKDIRGKKFGKLSPIRPLGPDTHGHMVWECLCECGNVTQAVTRQLNAGKKQSCGCNRKFNNSPHWEGYGELSKSTWSKILREAESRGLSFSLSIEEAWNLFLKQNRRCAYSDLPLSMGNKTHDSNRTASLDRIDSSKGYDLKNVQWVHKHVNMMKQNYSEKYFLSLIRLIYKHKKPIGVSSFVLTT